MATPNLFDKGSMSRGIDRPSLVYVDSKKDNFVKAPFTLFLEPSRLAVRAAFTATRSEHRLRPNWLRPSANRLGQAARPARRRGDRKQEAVELNSKCLCGMNETKSKNV
jgi:hypothetical protein